MKTKRKLRPGIKYSLYILIGIILISAIFSLLPQKFDGVTSVNANADKLSKGNCLIFYEKGNAKHAKKILKNLCDEESDNEQVFDYKFKQYGKYSYSDYGEIDLLVDEKNNIPSVNKIESKEAMMIISDYLRYTMKSNRLDYAYSVDFLNNSYYENLKPEMFKADIVGDDLHIYFNEYELDYYIPLIYIGKYIGIDLETNERYIKPTYVDPNRKTICLTFDDGPDPETTPQILNELYKYDATGTFFVVGTRLGTYVNPVIEDCITKGNQIGSHTDNHPDLCSLTKEEMFKEVNGPVEYLKANFNYTVDTYRPPYGSYNDEVDQSVPFAAILWTVDSNDWRYSESAPIAQNIRDYVYDGAIVILHDIHQTSIDAIIKEGLLEELVTQGYQFVTINDYAKAKNIELTQGTHLGWD